MVKWAEHVGNRYVKYIFCGKCDRQLVFARQKGFNYDQEKCTNQQLKFSQDKHTANLYFICCQYGLFTGILWILLNT